MRKQIGGVFLVSLLLVLSCKKEMKEIGAPASKMDGIMANWQLAKAIQVDELSLTKESANIYGFLTESGTLPNILFSDSTYTVDTLGLEFNFFGGPSGKWHFDNVLYPSKVTFLPDAGGSIELKLNGPIRPQDNLKLAKEVVLSCKEKNSLAMTYVLEFKRK